MATVVSPTAPERPGTRLRPYLPIAIFALCVAFVGFWANYYGRIFTGTVITPPIIQVHAAILIGWLLLVITQATLAARGRMALHMKFGRYVMAYGVAVVAIGLIGTIAATGTHLEAGRLERARALLFVGFSDMATFAPFLAAPDAAVLLIWLAPIYAGMIYDWVTRRIVHPVYVVGILAILFLKYVRGYIIESEAWQSTATWALTLY